MPSHPSWIHRLPEILSILTATKTPFLDRAACEKLFRLRRAAAVDLMNKLGGVQFGKSLVVGRVDLMAKLRQLQKTPEFSWRQGQRRRVAEAIAASPRSSVVIEPAPHLEGRSFDDLPGVTLTAGRLSIDYEGGQDLLQKLFALSKSFAANPTRFIERAGPAKRGSSATLGLQH